MKTSCLGKKLSQIGIAAAVTAVFIMAPFQAQATSINWANLDGAGAPGAFILLDKLNTIGSPSTNEITYDVGADKSLSNGDSFTHTLTLLTTSSSLTGGSTNFDLAGDYRFELNLTGTVFDVGGTPTVINPDNSVSSDATSVYSFAYTAGTIELWNNPGNIKIADLIFVSGGATNLHLVAGSIGNVPTHMLLGPGCINCDPYLRDAGGGTITGSEILTIATGSTRFLNFNNSDFATNTLIANFQDNGQSSTFAIPEPASLLLMGIGLLGLGAFRRGRKFN